MACYLSFQRRHALNKHFSILILNTDIDKNPSPYLTDTPLNAHCVHECKQTQRLEKWGQREAEGAKSLTVLCILMFGVGEGQVRVGPAGQARAAARLGVATAPQSDSVLRGHDAIHLGVCIWPHTDWVVTVRHAQVTPVCRYVGREGLAKAEVSQREICPCSKPRRNCV